MEDHKIEDLLALKNIEKVIVDSTGNKVAALATCIYREYKKKEFHKYIYIYKEDFTLDHIIEGMDIVSIDFSNDGRLLYTDKKGLHITGTGESEINISVTGNIQQAMWMNEKILFTAKVSEKKAPDDAYFFEENEPLSELYILDLAGSIRKITKNIHIWEFDTDGENIYAVTSEKPMESCWYRSKISRINLDGKIEMVYDPDFRELGKIKVHKNRVAFLESIMSDRGVISGDIIVIENGKVKNITDGSDSTYSHIEFSGDSMYALENKQGTFTIRNLDTESEIWKGAGIIFPAFAPAFSTNGNVFVFAYSSEKEVAEVVKIESGKKIKSSINGELQKLKVYPSETVQWKSTDGKEIYGFFRAESPDNPLVVYIHGGPTSFSYPAFIDRTTMYLGAGFSLFLPNYRGSVGMGRKYAESNRGDMGGMDFEDVITGINYLKQEGKIKTDRIYITGGSYGGYMSALAIMKSDLFKASVSLFGISDWISFHGVSNLYNWDRIHMDQNPYDFQKYDKFSAIRMKHDVKTPILLMHGMEDPYVPIGQYYEFYRFLKENGKNARLLIYPREGHGFTEKDHMIRQYRETIDFFNRYR